jgi:hypothetical protein
MELVRGCGFDPVLGRILTVYKGCQKRGEVNGGYLLERKWIFVSATKMNRNGNGWNKAGRVVSVHIIVGGRLEEEVIAFSGNRE